MGLGLLAEGEAMKTLKHLHVLCVMLAVMAGTARVPAADAPEAAADRFHRIDLKDHLTLKFEDIDKDPDSAWRYVPHGDQTFDGTPFQMQGNMQVAGLRAARENRKFATSVRGIPVNRRGSRLHVLHGAGENLANGVPLASLVLNFADGTKQTLPLVYGQNVRNWYKSRTDSDQVSDPGSKVVWTGTSPRSDRFGMTLRLYRSSFALNFPGVEVQSIDFISLMSESVSVIAGLTLETSPVPAIAAKDATETRDPLPARAETIVRMIDRETKKPITNAQLKIRVEDPKASYAFGDLKTNEKGEATLEFPAKIASLELTARAPGYAARVQRISVADLKNDFIIDLGPGETIGGVVRDEQKNPVANADVIVLGATKDAVGQVLLVEYDKVTTDNRGNWRCDSAPKGSRELSFKVEHPDFVTEEFSETDGANSEADQLLNREDLAGGKANMLVKLAPRLQGIVRNEQNQPIPRANVILNLEPAEGAPSGGEDIRQLSIGTDEKGFFRFNHLQPGAVTVVVMAKGLAPAKESSVIESGVKSIDVQLKPGVAFSGRLLEGEEPVAGAAIRPVRWNGVNLSFQTETDSRGEFVWDSGPDAPVLFSFSKAGFQETLAELEPGKKKTVQLGRRFQMSGKVIDAETGQPIKDFTMVQGRSFGFEDEESMRWEPNDRRGNGGIYSFRGDRETPGGKIKILMRAEGYLPEESPFFESRGWNEYDFKLKKGSGPAGVVLDENGREVEGAEVAILGAGYVALGKEGLREIGRRGPVANSVKSDAQGRFALPALLKNPTIIAVHKKGFALLENAKSGEVLALLVKPWGRIEGFAKNGTRPAANVTLMIAPERKLSSLLNYDSTLFRTTTAEDGRFEFEGVPAIPSQLVRLTRNEGQNSWRWSQQQRIDVAPGATTRVNSGGMGRPVIGKLSASRTGEKVNWTGAECFMSTKIPQPPARFNNPEEARAWNKSPEVKSARENQRNYGVELSADGSFRVENVPPGEYTLTVLVRETGLDPIRRGGKILGSLRHEIVVEEIAGGVSDEPLDVGQLTVQSQ